MNYWIALAVLAGFVAGFVAMGLLVRADRRKTWQDLCEGRYRIHEAYRDMKVPRHEDAEEVLLCARRWRCALRHPEVLATWSGEEAEAAIDALLKEGM